MRQSSFANRGTFSGMLHTIAIPSPKARAIIINIPGYKGDIHGYNNKYDKIGAMLAERGIGAFVEMPNRAHEFNDNYLVMVRDLEIVIRAASRESRELCATSAADIYLMGTSAGGAGVAAVAGHFAEVKKILLVAPAFSEDEEYYDLVEKSIERFRGDVSIVVGEDDHVTGVDDAQRYYNLSQHAESRRIVTIPNCGHQFQGEKNGMILSKAPLWAFAGDTTFPSPEGGLKVYE